MHLANVNGRGSVIIDNRVIDVEEATDGSISSDPMELANNLNHSILSELTLNDGSPQLDESKLGPPIPRPGKIIAIATVSDTHLTLPTTPYV